MSEPPSIPYEPPLVPGRLVRRYKRFLADVRLDSGPEVVAHCPSPGGMAGLLQPGSRVYLSDHRGQPGRKLGWTWRLASDGDVLVGVDTLLSNHLVEAAVRCGAVPALAGYETVRREVRRGPASRLDLLLSDHRDDPRRCWVEVKTATLAADGEARFPDARTTRGLRHLEELVAAVAEGDRAVAFLLVQRDDVEAFAPAWDIDPAWAAGLTRAASAGVEIEAWTARVAPTGVAFGRRLPVRLLDPPAPVAVARST